MNVLHIYLLLFATIFVFAIRRSHQTRYHKCCEKDEGLNRTVVNGKPIFRCIHAHYGKSHVHPLEKSNLTVKSLVECRNNLNHTCIDKILIDEGTQSKEQRLVKVHCKKEHEILEGNVITLRKCCPKDTVYMTIDHRCAYSDEAENFLDKFQGIKNESELTNVEVGLVNCEEAVVDHIINSTLNSESLGEEGLQNLLKEFNPRGRDYCLDVTDEQGILVMRVCEPIKSVCNKKTCVRKCCPDGHHYRWSRKCMPSFNATFRPTFHRKNPKEEWGWKKMQVDEFAQIQGLRCKNKRYMLEEGRFDMKLSDRGHLHLNDGLVLHSQAQTYCMEFIESEKMNGNYFFNCFPEQTKIEFQTKVFILRFFLSASCVFLLVTVVIYALYMPRNLHAKTILSHCCSLCLAYMCLWYAQWSEHVRSTLCAGIGFSILFTFLVAFSWLNIMCFDIWWTFGSFRGMAITDFRRSEEDRKFIWYSVYGWVFPLVITCFGIIADTTDIVSEEFRPNMGHNMCFFRQPFGWAYFTMFVAPMGLQILCNLVFFVLTVRYCIKVKLEIHRMQESRKMSFLVDKTNLALNMKLLLVMGISWTLEVISLTVGGDRSIWLISDIYNAIQGLPIFVIYVLKPNVIKEVRAKMKCLKQKQERRASQTVSTGVSTSTNLAVKVGASGKMSKKISNASNVSNTTAC